MEIIKDVEEMTKFELARLLGARALQLELGAPPLINLEGYLETIDIARDEYDKGVLPLLVIREKDKFE